LKATYPSVDEQINCGISRQWAITQCYKEVSSPVSKRHGGASNAYDYVKEANPERLHTYWMVPTAKKSKQDKTMEPLDQWLPGVEEEKNEKRSTEKFRAVKLLCIRP
jgi:hypothetical protein